MIDGIEEIEGSERAAQPPGPVGMDPDPDPAAAVVPGGEANCPPSKTEVFQYAEKNGIPSRVALDFFDHYAGLNWMTQSGPIADYRPRLEKWARKEWSNSIGGAPTSSTSGGVTANRIGLEKAIGLLRIRIENHPANPDSVAGVAEPSEAQKSSFREDKKKLREMEDQLTNAV